MKYFVTWYNRPFPAEPQRPGKSEMCTVVEVPDGSQIADLAEPCELGHRIGIVSPTGGLLVCADSIRPARPEDENRTDLGEWS